MRVHAIGSRERYSRVTGDGLLILNKNPLVHKHTASTPPPPVAVAGVLAELG